MIKTNTYQSANYKSEKLTFCAYLIASGKAQLIEIRPTGNGQQVILALSNVPTSQETAQFYNGMDTISALRFSEAISMLESVAYKGRR